MRLLRDVFMVFLNAGLTGKFKKYVFMRKEINYLGAKITKCRIEIGALSSPTPTPKKIKQVAAFLGMTARFLKFIKCFSKLCETFYALRKQSKVYLHRGLLNYCQKC